MTGVQETVPFHWVVPIINPNTADVEAEELLPVAEDAVFSVFTPAVVLALVSVVVLLLVGGRNPNVTVNDTSIGVVRCVTAGVAVRHRFPFAIMLTVKSVTPSAVVIVDGV